jgi:DNA-binding response OmpR family regulator
MKLYVVDSDSAIHCKSGASRRFQSSGWDTFAADGLRIDFPTQTVHVDGRLVALTDTEYRLLRHLVRNAGQVLSPRALLQQASSADCATTDLVRFQVSRLRAKLEPDRASPRYIFREPGVGYWFRGPTVGPLSEQPIAA